MKIGFVSSVWVYTVSLEFLSVGVQYGVFAYLGLGLFCGAVLVNLSNILSRHATVQVPSVQVTS